MEGAVGEIFAACASGAVVTGWALHLGASAALVGALSALPIAAQVFHLPAALLTDRHPRRGLAIAAVSGSRLAWAPMILVPLLGIDEGAGLALLVSITVLSSILAVLGNNAWNAWIGDLVPERLRGRFFGRRTVWITAARAASSLASAVVLDAVHPSLRGLALGAVSICAVVAGLATVLLLRAQIDPHPERAPVGLGAFRSVLRDRRARAYLVYQLAWSAAIAPAASYFALYVLDVLALGFSFLAAHTVIAALVRIATARWCGRAVDRLGAPFVLAACSVAIAVMPLLWCLAAPDRIGPLVCDAVVCGVAWGAHHIASMQWSLAIASQRERPFYLAAFATAGGVGIAGAVLACTAILSVPEEPGRALPILFVTSAVLRFACAFLAGRLTRTESQYAWYSAIWPSRSMGTPRSRRW